MVEAFRDILDEVIAALGPLVDAARDPQDLMTLLADLGWTPNSAPQPLHDLAQAGAELIALIGADPAGIPALQAIDAVKRLVDAVNAIQSKPGALFPGGIDVASFKATIGRDLLDYIFVEHLLRNRHQIGGLLKLAGLIRLVETPAAGARQAHIKRQVAWNRIGALLTDPIQGFREAFEWNSAAPQLNQVLAGFASLLESYQLQLAYFEPGGDLLSFINAGATTPAEAPLGAALAFDSTLGAPDGVSAGIQLVLLPPTAARGPAIAWLPYAQLNGAKKIPLSETLSLSLRGNADFTKGIALILAPGREPEVRAGFLGGTATIPAEVQLGLKAVPPDQQAERRLIGAADASRLSIHTATVSLGARLLAPGQAEAFVELELEQARGVIKPAPGEADPFLGRLLGDGGVSAELSFGLRLSSRSGFHLTGSGGLEVRFPLHVALGPIDFQALTLALKPSGQDVNLEVGASIAAKLGPLAAVVEQAGFKLNAKFPNPPAGNLGALDLSFAFSPPKGVGLSLDAGVIKGGGYLFFDFEKQEYAGALELSFSEIISLKAIGIITTKMPDGSNGFSLLIIITAEFTPIQLGFGFTLIGVGGLLGLNRTVLFDPLRAGVRDGSLNSVLFPQDVVANAPRIINDLKRIFPPMQDRFLIGPMAKFGWGTPTLISLELGIILEIPRPAFAILGVLRMALPAEDVAVLNLQVNFLGVVDFEKKQISFDASLYDSRLLTFTLTGDMAVRLYWGENANFLLSVGGFHPACTPPPMGLGPLNRLAITIFQGNPTLRAECYFAVTSNTVQFGAKVELSYGVKVFNVYGFLSLDVLIQFNPFHFIAEIAAMLAVRTGSKTLFSVRLELMLEGPTPWHARGRASFEIGFIFTITISVRFDVTFGDEQVTTLPAITVLPRLREALENAGNWRAALPSANNLQVCLRELPQAKDLLVVHPFGSLNVSQKVVPLNLEISRFGTQKPENGTLFRISEIKIAGETVAASSVKEQFAPAQFLEMSDAEKLSRRSFEAYDGGVQIADDKTRADYFTKQTVAYEVIYVPERQRRLFYFLGDKLFSAFVRAAAVAKSALSFERRGPSELGTPKVSLEKERYVVAAVRDLSPFSAAHVFESEAEAIGAMARLTASDPALRSELQVAPFSQVNMP